MIATLLVTLLLVAVAIVLLGIQILLKKGGKFPSGHISASKPMQDRGISCALSTDAKERKSSNLSDRINRK